MSASFHLGPVDRITAGAIGEPGDRTFLLQARAGGEQVTIVVEKEQVRVLCEAMQRLLDALPDGHEGREPVDGDLELVSPLEPVWRAGEMSIEHDALTDHIVVLLTELVEDAETEIPGRARFEASRAQVRAMSEHALEVVSAGRPRCQLCGYPMGPGGVHRCPAMNGHRSYL